MKLSQIGEFGLIERLTRGLLPLRRGVGIGDDAAVIPYRGRSLLLTTDMLIEGRHFRRGWGDPEWIGVRAMGVNVSDIAAMGGRPICAVVSLGLPANISVEEVAALYRGMSRAADPLRLKIVGGDTNRARFLVINVTLLGEVAGRPVLRSGALPGDYLYVTGPLGEAACGLELLRKGDLPEARRRVTASSVRRYWFPPNRVGVGQALRRLGVHAMMDVSDGLLADLRHLAEASRVGVELWEESVPVVRGDKKTDPKKMRRLALTGGDDYELIFTHSRRVPARLCHVPITCIGRVRERRFGLKICGSSDKIRPFPKRGGYRHF